MQRKTMKHARVITCALLAPALWLAAPRRRRLAAAPRRLGISAKVAVAGRRRCIAAVTPP
jgi:hypothetical protein